MFSSDSRGCCLIDDGGGGGGQLVRAARQREWENDILGVIYF